MNVTGKAYQTTNIRSKAKVVNTPTNVVGKLLANSTFTGTKVQVANETWIKLDTINGTPITAERFVAAWVVEYKDVVVTPPPAGDEIVKAVLHFDNGSTQELFPQ